MSQGTSCYPSRGVASESSIGPVAPLCRDPYRALSGFNHVNSGPACPATNASRHDRPLISHLPGLYLAEQGDLAITGRQVTTSIEKELDLRQPAYIHSSKSWSYPCGCACSPTSCFDVDEVDLSGNETDVTGLDVQNNDNLDVEDQIQLFGGNIHPPEYYRLGIEQFNESSFGGEDYSPGSTVLLDAIEVHWQR